MPQIMIEKQPSSSPKINQIEDVIASDSLLRTAEAYNLLARAEDLEASINKLPEIYPLETQGPFANTALSYWACSLHNGIKLRRADRCRDKAAKLLGPQDDIQPF